MAIKSHLKNAIEVGNLVSLLGKRKKGKGKRIEAFSVGQVRERGRKVGTLGFKRRERRATEKMEGVVLFLGFFFEERKVFSFLW